MKDEKNLAGFEDEAPLVHHPSTSLGPPLAHALTHFRCLNSLFYILVNIYWSKFDLRILSGKNSKHLISKCLADKSDVLKIKHNGLEFLDAI